MRLISTPFLRHAAFAVVAGCAALLAAQANASPAAAATVTVTTEADEGGSAGNTAACSLREAIQSINGGSASGGCANSSGAGFGTDDRIQFNIPTGTMANPPVARIVPNPRLPNLTRSMTIDGYTQAGAKPNTNPANPDNQSQVGLNTVIRVEIDGSSQPNGPIFRVLSSDTTIRGLAIFGGPADGIRLLGSGGHTVVGNYIGTDATGTGGAGNESDGVVMESTENTVGGLTPESRNLISNNGQQGVRVINDDNTIQGNLIGTTRSGLGDLGNGRQGVLVAYGYRTKVGDEDNPAARNVISGNDLDGILVKECACATANTIIGNNYIGVDATGLKALPNRQSGIQLRFEPVATTIVRNVISGNRIDGILLDAPGPITFVLANKIGVGANGITPVGNGRDGVNTFGTLAAFIGFPIPEGGNIIAHNVRNGVTICDCSEFNPILGNSIHSNGGLAIDLENDGVSPNDDNTQDADSGGNGLQNFPVLTSATFVGTGIRVAGTLDSLADTEFLVQIFANDSCDPSGFGEARRYLGDVEVETDSNGLVSFESASFANAIGARFITATATSLNGGNTSEVSRCLAAPGGDDPDPNNNDETARKGSRDDTDKDVKETEEEKQQRERTNRSNKDDYATEGNVVEVCAADESPACVYIANRDGKVKIVLLGDAAKVAKDIKVGDYLEVDGEKIHEYLYEATDVKIKRGRR